jgi:hypothetical protein
MRTALYWVITQRGPLKMGPIGCPETSARNTTTSCAVIQKRAVLMIGSVFPIRKFCQGQLQTPQSEPVLVTCFPLPLCSWLYPDLSSYQPHVPPFGSQMKELTTALYSSAWAGSWLHRTRVILPLVLSVPLSGRCVRVCIAWVRWDAVCALCTLAGKTRVLATRCDLFISFLGSW